MTYAVQAVATVGDVVTSIVAFAVARGWTSGGAGNIVNPVTGQSYDLTTGTNTLTVTATGSGVSASFRLPYLLGVYTATPIVSLPSQVHLFGNNSPYSAPDSVPYISCVVECGYNQYRHIYIGSIVRAGDYTNGDVFSTNNFYEAGSGTPTSVSYSYTGHRYLFGAHTANAKAGGGAKITHVDNADTWREFSCLLETSTLDAPERFLGTEVFGGNNDGTNDGFLYRAHAEYGAAQILVPINLYVSKASLGSDYRIRPVGHVSGARLVDMQNLAPGQQISIGSDNWRVFPEFTKSATLTITRASGQWWPAESSYNLGLAYRE